MRVSRSDEANLRFCLIAILSDVAAYRCASLILKRNVEQVLISTRQVHVGIESAEGKMMDLDYTDGCVNFRDLGDPRTIVNLRKGADPDIRAFAIRIFRSLIITKNTTPLIKLLPIG